VEFDLVFLLVLARRRVIITGKATRGLYETAAVFFPPNHSAFWRNVRLICGDSEGIAWSNLCRIGVQSNNPPVKPSARSGRAGY
jgi:hypothetical protein